MLIIVVCIYVHEIVVLQLYACILLSMTMKKITSTLLSQQCSLIFSLLSLRQRIVATYKLDNMVAKYLMDDIAIP